jgi:hypothetical protein
VEISKEQLLQKALKVGIPKEQVDELWISLNGQNKPSDTSPLTKLLYYFGALIVISAMTWLMTLSAAWFGDIGLFLVSTGYAILLAAIGAVLWHKKDLQLPGGLLITIAVCMVPLAIYALESHFNIRPVIPRDAILMELGTIIAGLIALRFFDFPFLTAPIYFAVWFMSMDTIPLMMHWEPSQEKTEWISLGLGCVVLLIAYATDLKNRKDYAFWGYFFGLLAFWISLSNIVWNKGEFVLFIYLLISLCLMGLSLLLKQKVFLVYGALGVMTYLGHLAYDIFQNSLLFPFVISFIGLLVIYLGFIYQRHIASIDEIVDRKSPAWLKRLLPPESKETR